MHEIRGPMDAGDGEPVFVTAWHVSDGARVEGGDLIATIETAKATMDVVAPGAGTIEIVATAGSHDTGALIARLHVAGGASVEVAAASHALPRVRSRVVPVEPRKVDEIRALSAEREGQLPTTLAVDVPIAELTALLGARDDPPPIGLAAVVVHALARALPRHPLLNARWSAAGIEIYEEVNVGVAIDAMGKGLRVPVVRGAEAMTLAEISATMQLNLYRYLRGELTPSAMAGATITVSDLTPDRIPWFVPLIPRGQSAIVGLGLETRAAAFGGDVLRIIVTADHRVVDGRTVAALLRDVGDRVGAVSAALARGDQSVIST